MVYSGRPSTACHTCRQRRIKCDELRPTCQQCIRVGKECTGYPDAQDLLFKHQATAEIKRSKRALISQLRKNSTPPGSTPGSTGSDDTVKHVLITNPAQSLDSLALRLYLSGMLIDPMSQGRHVGHLEILPRLYLQSPRDSALARVTDCCCLAALSVFGGLDSSIQTRAYQAYGTAVVSLQRALLDVEQRKKNETLLATMLMLVAECMLARDRSPQQQWAMHITGAAGLCTERGASIHQDPTGRKILQAVGKFLEQGARERGEPLCEFFVVKDPPDEVPPERMLGQISTLLEYLRRDVVETLASDSRTPVELEILLQQCQELDRDLETWAEELPSSHRFQVQQVQGKKKADISWLKKKHIYSDAHNHRLWNSWRVARIWTNALTYRLLTAQSPDDDHTEAIANTKQNLQQMANDICASIPSELTTATPRSNSQFSQLEHVVMATYMLWPLYIARGILILGSHQRDWIRRKIIHISETFQIRHGISLAANGDGAGEKPLWVKRWDDSGIETAWEYGFLYGCGAL